MRVNAWWHPQAQQALSVKTSESDAMIVGRIAGDVAAAVVGAVEMADGVGIAGGGAIVGCGTTLCLVSGAAVTAGGAIALQGVGTGVNAAVGIAQNAALLSQGKSSKSSDSSKIHGNSLGSPQTTYFYELVDENGNHLKYGITSDPNKRYTQSFMQDKKLIILAKGTRRSMYDLEHEMIINTPRGQMQMNTH